MYHPVKDASKDEMCICDLLAAVVSLHPELISTEDNFSVSVELGGTYTRGMMVIDRKIEEHPGVTLNKHCVFKLPKQLDMKKIMNLGWMIDLHCLKVTNLFFRRYELLIINQRLLTN